MSWPLVKLDSLVEILSGFAFKSENFNNAGDGLPLVRIRDVVPGVSDTYYSGEYSSEFLLSDGDLLIGMDGDFNRARWNGGRALLNQRVCKITAKGESLDQGYLYHFLPKALDKIHAETPAVTVKHLSVKGIRAFEIPLPPLAEQKRIAAILDKADAIRRKRQQAIQLSDDFLRAVFLDMFGSSVDKSGWQEVRFDEVALIDAKMVDPREADYLELLHIGPDRIEKNTGKLLPALTAREENLISKKFLFDQSYVLYSKIRPYLRKVALPDFIGLCSADMYPVRPRDGFLTREFLWQLLLSDDFTKYTETLPGRANIPKLNRNELTSYCFKLPPIDLQRKFTEIFKKQHQGYLSSKSAREISDAAFGALSQKAFRGEL